jgi:hypothetical protein
MTPFERVAHGYTAWVRARPFADVAGFLAYLEWVSLEYHLSEWILARTIEDVRAACAAGSDGVWVDDALSTCELISLPFTEPLHRLPPTARFPLTLSSYSNSVP